MRATERRRGLHAFALLLLMTPLFASAQADIAETEGVVEIYLPRVQSWLPVKRAPYRVEAGDKLRTGAASRATLTMPDGSRALLGPSTELAIEAVQASESRFSLAIGTLRSWVQKSAGRRFQVKTPTAVCAVRGTQFTLGVNAARHTLVDVSEGVVAVKTLLGEEIELGDGRSMRSIRILPDRPLERAAERQAARAAPAAPPAKPAEAPKPAVKTIAAVREEREETTAPRDASDEFKKDVEREVALGQSKDAVQAAAAVEMRRAEYQEGKTLIDAFGRRVRLEEYVVRPAADQFKLVALSEREERLDYFYYQARFNQALPTDLREATRHLNGKTGAAPDYFVTEFETGRSNSRDTVQEVGTGGHLVNTPLAADKVVYDGATDAFQTVSAGTAFWETLFDNYSFRVNGTEKYGWQPNAGPNITAYDYTATGFNTRVWNGAGTNVCANQACEDALRTSAITKPSGADKLHDRVTITYTADGSQEIYDFFVIADDGRIAAKSDFGGATTGKAYKDKLVEHNFQQRLRFTEFGGRDIDFVVEPKILIKAGIIE